MRDNPETDPDIIAATAIDGRNAILNVNKAEALGLVTAGAAPAAIVQGGAVGGFVSFQAAETVAVPGQYSTAPVYTGGSGSGGNPGGGGYGGYDCPRLDQWTRVRDENGLWTLRQVGSLTLDDWLWHPILREFFKIRHAEVLRQSIWELITEFGAVGYSSGRHAIIRSQNDHVGLQIERFEQGSSVLCLDDDGLADSRASSARATGEVGEVMWLEMEAENVGDKIYCYGASPDKMIVCHNLKREPEEPQTA